MTTSIGAGGAFKAFVGVSVGAGGAWKTVQGEWIGVGGVWKQFYSAVAPFAVVAQNATSAAEPGVASVTFTTDGYLNSSDGNVVFWGLPITAGAGSGYWVRVVIGGGNGVTTGGPYSTWLQLNAARTFSIATASGVSGVSRNRNMTYQIATDAAGATVVGSGTIVLSSTVP